MCSKDFSNKKYTNIGPRHNREKLINDPFRPLYHFLIPEGDEMLSPNDSNGTFYADGLYHMMYLYRNRDVDGHNWGHMVSNDLLHWRHLPDALSVYNGDDGCFSGGAFVDDDGIAYVTFWKLSSHIDKTDVGGVAIAYSAPPYIKWERIEPIADISTEFGMRDIIVDGKVLHLGSCDPSNIWKINNKYYMQYGNKPVLDKYGTGENADTYYEGGWTELYSSTDLKNWTYLHRFYDVDCRNCPEGWPDYTEDAMCPVFLPLYDSKENGKKTNKWIQLFISHNKGCQYFIGEFENEKFLPEIHGRMSWSDITYFAPEGLVDNKNRTLLFTWIKDNLPYSLERFGWSGVYAIPRIIWWENNELHIAPINELSALQYNHCKIHVNNSDIIPVKNGESFRLKAVFNPANGKNGFKLRMNESESEYTEVYYDLQKEALIIDTTNSGTEGEKKCLESAPLKLNIDEPLTLDIFVDKSVVEVFANERQAVCRRIFPDDPSSLNVKLIGTSDELVSLDAWEMMASNPY